MSGRAHEPGTARWPALLCAASVSLASFAASAANVWLPGAEGGNVSIRTLQDLKFEHVVRQRYDFSCGSAALATLLTFHYGDPTTEERTFSTMYEKGDRAKIARVGFSLLDMKNYLEAHGYEADGYEASLDTLAEAGVAAIALINYRGYQHFVVVKGIRNGEVLVGDPALGVRVMSRPDFEAMWPSRILFIIRNRTREGQSRFNLVNEWKAIPRAPLGDAINREGLASISIMLPYVAPNGLGDF